MQLNRPRNLDRNITAVIFVALMVLVVIQIIMRVIFLAPLVGAEELVRYFLICIIFIGAPFAARNGGHIRMEEFQAMLPKPLRRVVRFLSFLSAVVVFGIVSYSSVLTLFQNINNRTATLSMPFWIFILPTVFGFLLLTMEYGILFAEFLRNPDGERKEAA